MEEKLDYFENETQIAEDSNELETISEASKDPDADVEERGHSTIMWTRRGGEGVSQMSTLLHRPY